MLPPSLITSSRRARGDRWSVVLSGGDGARLRGFIARRFGEARPKQYCTFAGTRSLVQHAVDRAVALAGVDRTITVVAAEHARWARPQLGGRGRVVVEPTPRGTLAGLLLPLARIRARAPAAVVDVLPADHFVDPEDRFLAVMRAAGAAAAEEPTRVVLLGAAPREVELDYRYVEARARRDGFGAAAVERIAPPDDRSAAIAAIARGALWSTAVATGTAEALWQAAREAAPDVVALFDEVVEALDTPFEDDVIAAVYQRVRHVDLIDVLGAAPGRCLVVRMGPEVEWCDFGRADRIERTLTRLARARRVTASRGAA